MMGHLDQALNFTALTLFILIAGFFYAFSVCVMPGLNRTDPAVAIEAMQAINEAVRNPLFFVTFFLTPVAAVLAALVAWHSGSAIGAIFMAGAAITYFALALLLTANINVPMNEALALVDLTSADAAEIWADYSERWTFWNTFRTVASTIAALLFVAGIMQRG
ncbi:MAG: anthrone oxygenase family protein [Pseudomonadota bacterium]